MEPGWLVEFFEEKRILVAMVLELKGERLHVLTQNSREMTLARKRLLHACPGKLPPGGSRQQILERLQETARLREELKQAIDLTEIWELLAAENEPQSTEELARLWFNGTSCDQVAAMGRALFEDRFLFKFKEGLWVPNPPEVVAALQERARREEEERRELAEAAEWLRAAWDRGEISDPLWRERLVELMKQEAVFGEEAPEHARIQAYLDKAGLTAPDAAFRLLVRLGVFSEDENLDLYRLEVPTEFEAETRELARRLMAAPPPDPLASRRLDLTGLECFTIDGERTRDFDDALSLEETPEGLRLGVHIADVASVVAPTTPLDAEARERATSIYLPELRLPMFPEELSENTLSLLEGEERLALSFLIHLTPAGEVRDAAIHPSVIRVKRRLTYAQVDAILEGDPVLRRLADLTARLKARRLAAGGYELKLPEIWVTLNHQGGVQVVVEDQETVSHQMVSEAMVLANWLAARFLAEHRVPAIYRGQPEPREPIDREAPKDLVALWQDRKRLSRVVMDLEPQPHWGLGLPLYTMASSPIRRFLDLVIHRQLLAVLGGGPPAYSRPELEQILMTIEPAMRRAGLLKTRRLRYWLLKYLAGQVGSKKEALVLEQVQNRWRLLLPEVLLEVPLTAPASLKLRPGDTVLVRLDKVSPRDDLVKLSLA
ncbi:MAG: RNB domain-containing ribonuclease [Syntrophobacterales bacterium]|nr:RNB domain-containing ribonuclease [Syntrophobacterales bacterium]